jgi:hypothetical protein
MSSADTSLRSRICRNGVFVRLNSTGEPTECQLECFKPTFGRCCGLQHASFAGDLGEKFTWRRIHADEIDDQQCRRFIRRLDDIRPDFRISARAGDREVDIGARLRIAPRARAEQDDAFDLRKGYQLLGNEIFRARSWSSCGLAREASDFCTVPLLGDTQFILLLQIEPEFGTHAEPVPKTKRGVGG